MSRKGNSGMSNGGRSSSSSNTRASGGGMNLTSSERSAISGNSTELERSWLSSDEEWVSESDPYDVAAEIINFESKGPSWDDSVYDKLNDFGDSFVDSYSDAAFSVAVKLTEASNKNILRKYSEVKEEYDRIKREGF